MSAARPPKKPDQANRRGPLIVLCGRQVDERLEWIAQIGVF